MSKIEKLGIAVAVALFFCALNMFMLAYSIHGCYNVVEQQNQTIGAVIEQQEMIKEVLRNEEGIYIPEPKKETFCDL